MRDKTITDDLSKQFNRLLDVISTAYRKTSEASRFRNFVLVSICDYGLHKLSSTIQNLLNCTLKYGLAMGVRI